MSPQEAIERNLARRDVTLSSGRIIRHRREPNGSELALPMTGPKAMTDAEFEEYVEAIRDKYFR